MSVATSDPDASSHTVETFALPNQRRVSMIFMARARASCGSQINARRLIGVHIPLNLSC